MDISPDEFRRCPKNPPCAFFLIQDGRHHVTLFFEKTGVCPNLLFLQLKKRFLCLYLCFKAQGVYPDYQKIYQSFS